jgi:hypothetical protein
MIISLDKWLVNWFILTTTVHLQTHLALVTFFRHFYQLWNVHGTYLSFLFSFMITWHGIFEYLAFSFCKFHPLSKQWARSEFSDYYTKSCVKSSNAPLHVTTYNTCILLPLNKTIYVNCGYHTKKLQPYTELRFILQF